MLSIQEYKPIFWEILNADYLFQQTANQDTIKKKKPSKQEFYQRIFKEHKTTKEQFYYTYHYYQMHPLEMKVLIDSVEAYGTRKKNKSLINKQKPENQSPKSIPVE